LLDRLFDHPAEKGAGKGSAVNICHVRAQHQRGLLLSGQRLKIMRLADR
jgi:hypothetical protein